MASSGSVLLRSDSDDGIGGNFPQQLLREGPYGDAILCAYFFHGAEFSRPQ